MGNAMRRFDFAAITDPRWRLVAKEMVFALLAPRHEAVALLPRAYRTALHLSTAYGRLIELARFLNWLTEQGVTSLGDVDTGRCEAYLAHRRYLLDEDAVVVGELSPATRRSAAQAVIDLVNYRELFSHDRVPAGLRPWGGAAASAIAGMPSGTGQNKTPPLKDEVFSRCWPPPSTWRHASARTRPTAPARSVTPTGSGRMRSGDRRAPPGCLLPRSRSCWRIRSAGEPLPLAAGTPPGPAGRRVVTGRPADSIALTCWPARPVSPSSDRHWIPHLRGRIEATLRRRGRKPFGRDAAPSTAPTAKARRLDAAAGPAAGRRPGRDRPHRRDTAVFAAVSGMRASELMELQTGCRRPPEHYGPGLVRYRLASKVIKGQPLGGTGDEWVVIEPAYQAARLPNSSTTTPRRGPAVRPVRLRRPLSLVPQLGQRPGRPAPRARPDPRGPRQPPDAAPHAGDRARLPSRRGARREDAPQARRTSPPPKVMRRGQAVPRPSCSPRSTSTRPTATWSWSGPSSATTSRASCPPDQGPAN